MFSSLAKIVIAVGFLAVAGVHVVASRVGVIAPALSSPPAGGARLIAPPPGVPR